MALKKTKTMFDDCAVEDAPTSIEDCTNQDKVTVNLWKWASKLETFGKILLFIIIFGGILLSFASSTKSVYHEASYVTEAYYSDDFSPALFFTNLFTYLIYAFVEYCVYHVLALLIASLARIVQSNRTMARLAELQARNNEK